MGMQVLLAAGAALSAVAASNPADDAARRGIRPLADTLAYTLPSPPSAVYEIANSVVVGVNTPTGAMQVTGEIAMTLDLAFEGAANGVRVTGSVSSFDGSMSNPMMGRQTAGLDAVSGSLDFVLNRRGESEVAAVPAVAGGMAQFAPFESMAHSFFPRLPDQVVEAGGMWVDTVSWSSEDPTLDASSTSVYRYTLVGDTVVEGKTLAKIDVNGEVTSEAETNQGGMAITQSMAGSLSGVILWDMERGIMAGSEIEQTVEGTAGMSGMPPTPMTLTVTETVRLAG